MRRVYHSGSFFLALAINMLFRFEWLLLGIILYVLHRTAGFPLWPAWAALGVWLGASLLITLLLGWVSSAGSAPEPRKENINPYSAKTRELSGESTSGDKENIQE